MRIPSLVRAGAAGAAGPWAGGRCGRAPTPLHAQGPVGNGHARRGLSRVPDGGLGRSSSAAVGSAATGEGDRVTWTVVAATDFAAEIRDLRSTLESISAVSDPSALEA